MNWMRIAGWLIFLALGAPSLQVAAAQEGIFLGGWGGLGLLDETQAEGDGGDLLIDYDPGTAFGMTLGYDLGTAFPEIGIGRIELEIARRSNDLEDVEFSDGTLGAAGKLSVTSIMLNSFAEYQTADPWLPYLGAGLGYARVSLEDARAESAPLADDHDWVFAYQFGAGIGYRIGQRLVLDLGYRYFATLDPEFNLADGTSTEWEYDSHTANLGLRFHF